ncbi:hypothetical protein NPIL_399111 [Nephila pilipes]|uniref:Uncharacterized protein n=1 Tax=Nephila pilipes TaxID=299642 RepID=A0A8X6R8B9_NEPPI|nr:hypothetical protein NPIL_399111 [Nephila pilipes]
MQCYVQEAKCDAFTAARPAFAMYAAFCTKWLKRKSSFSKMPATLKVAGIGSGIALLAQGFCLFWLASNAYLRSMAQRCRCFYVCAVGRWAFFFAL